MQLVLRSRNLGVVGLAALLAAATVMATATFTAPAPGASLQPVGDAAQLIEILQGQHSVLWKSLGGAVTQLTVKGWPSRAGDIDLGGGLYIEHVDGADAGVVQVGEPPMSVEFEVEG